MIEASQAFVSPELTRADLFDTAFLEAAERLRLVARRVAPRGRFADQRSRDRGAGLEFQDYRPYVAGDDMRAIDWTVYQRLGRVFLRLFEEHEDLPLYLLPDVSRSAWLERPPRARAGLRAALALAAVSLGQHDSVGIFPFAEDLTVLQRPTSGKGRLMELASRMATLTPGGATDVRKAMQRFRALGLREGLCVVISDFFDPAGLSAIEDALRGVRHKLLLVQLVRASDRDPSLARRAAATSGRAGSGDDLRVIDCESRAVHDVSLTADVLARYRAAYDRFNEGLAAFARSRNAGLLALDCDADVAPQLAQLFENGRREV
ncbi:MAG: DUF58 domain-containing protein [Planctomycetota bacterium]